MTNSLCRHTTTRPAVVARLGLVAMPIVLLIATAGCRGMFRNAATERAGGRVDSMSSNGWTRLQVVTRGDIELTEDERDVKSVSPDGYFEISSRGWFSLSGRQYIVRAGADGSLSRRFTVNGIERPIDAEARAWIGSQVQRLVRDGFDAEGRVARLLAKEGPGGVLGQISRLSTDFAKARYFEQLLKQTPLDRPTAERALRQAGSEIGSDFEHARTLLAFVDAVVLDDALGGVFVEATASIGSDFEHARVLTALMTRQPPSPAIVKTVMASTPRIGSDFEKSRVLTKLVELYAIDGSTRDRFFAVVGTIGSDFERGRVLALLAEKKELETDTVLGLVQATSSMGSDFEKSRVLLRVIARQPVAERTQQALLQSAGNIGSDFERGRVLSAMLRQGALR